MRLKNEFIIKSGIYLGVLIVKFRLKRIVLEGRNRGYFIILTVTLFD
jgi:hypothetical protein